MASNLFVIIDTVPGSPKDLALAEALQPLGSYHRIKDGVFYVKSDFTAAEAIKRVMAFAGGGVLAVIDAAHVSYANIDPGMEELFVKLWNS